MSAKWSLPTTIRISSIILRVPKPNAMQSTEKKLVVVAIDGPAGAGKSTVAKALAARLNFSYIDTGAMYRALTLKALREKISFDNEEALVALAKKTFIDLQGNPQNGLKVMLDGEDVSAQIRT